MKTLVTFLAFLAIMIVSYFNSYISYANGHQQGYEEGYKETIQSLCEKRKDYDFCHKGFLDRHKINDIK